MSGDSQDDFVQNLKIVCILLYKVLRGVLSSISDKAIDADERILQFIAAIPPVIEAKLVNDEAFKQVYKKFNKKLDEATVSHCCDVIFNLF